MKSVNAVTTLCAIIACVNSIPYLASGGLSQNRTEPNSNSQFDQRCPRNMYAHEYQRCITADECRAIKKSVSLQNDFNLFDFPYIPHDGTCAIDCPSNFYPNGPSGFRVCTKCVGTCKKECPSANIESISSAQRYRGCTHINGPFTLSIQNPSRHFSDNFVCELETFLSDIEVIEGPLSVVRLHSISSLGFFKKLHTIKGDMDGKQKFGIRVLENQNLQALFTQKVTVEHGRMLFHFNPKLCMNNIKEFKNNVIELRNVSKLPSYEVAPDSNGDKTACDLTELDLKIKKTSHNSVGMELKPLPYEDEHQLLGYLLHYMPAPYQNVTMYDDTCGGDNWQIDDIIDNNRDSTPITILVTALKPYTQYAYFVQTYTVASEQRGGISPIKYFRTKPYRPDSVTKIAVSTNGSSEITMKWGPPIHANGNLTHYIITCTMNPDIPRLLKFRDFCEEPLGTEPVMSTDIFPLTFPTDSAKAPAEDTISKMDPTNTFHTYVYRKVNATVLSLTLNQLKHYSNYSISIKACRAGTGYTCGNEMIAYQRTGKIEDADDIKNLRVGKLPSKHTTCVLTWDEPENPNGLIVSYNIQYQQVNVEHAKPQSVCITQNLYHNNSKSYIIPDLVNGKYSFTVLANSLAGSSNRWTQPVYDEILKPNGIYQIILSILNLF